MARMGPKRACSTVGSHRLPRPPCFHHCSTDGTSRWAGSVSGGIVVSYPAEKKPALFHLSSSSCLGNPPPRFFILRFTRIVHFPRGWRPSTSLSKCPQSGWYSLARELVMKMGDGIYLLHSAGFV